MSTREQLQAYISTLAALVIVFMGTLLVSAWAPAVLGKLEVFGLGTITGGLIGVLRIPSARSPVAQTESGDVNLDTNKEQSNA